MPSLFARRAPGVEVYRFVWWRSFDPKVVVRIVRSGDRYVVVAKAGLERGELIQRRGAVTGVATPDSIQRIFELLKAEGFWNAAPYPSHGERDGSWWLIEASRDGAYHAVKRWSGEGIAASGAAMLRLAGLPIEGPVY